MRLISENDPDAIATLESRMLEFYSTVKNYNAYIESTQATDLWNETIRIATESEIPQVRICEIGAGKSGLGDYITKISPNLRKKIHLCCHDITTVNKEHLESVADEVIIGSVDSITGTWDIILHSYVLEHVVRPEEFLRRIYHILTPGGIHLFQCPRYDVPFYLPPAFDHLSWLGRMGIQLRRLWFDNRLTVVNDPAVLHLPWKLDRDAVHLVSKRQIARIHPDAKIGTFRVKAYGKKDWLVKNLLTLRMILRKPIKDS